MPGAVIVRLCREGRQAISCRLHGQNLQALLLAEGNLHERNGSAESLGSERRCAAISRYGSLAKALSPRTLIIPGGFFSRAGAATSATSLPSCARTWIATATLTPCTCSSAWVRSGSMSALGFCACRLVVDGERCPLVDGDRVAQRERELEGDELGGPLGHAADEAHARGGSGAEGAVRIKRAVERGCAAVNDGEARDLQREKGAHVPPSARRLAVLGSEPRHLSRVKPARAEVRERGHPRGGVASEQKGRVGHKADGTRREAGDGGAVNRGGLRGEKGTDAADNAASLHPRVHDHGAAVEPEQKGGKRLEREADLQVDEYAQIVGGKQCVAHGGRHDQRRPHLAQTRDGGIARLGHHRFRHLERGELRD
eukprot:3092746-Pleurochrysis_carterae.AAC.1